MLFGRATRELYFLDLQVLYLDYFYSFLQMSSLLLIVALTGRAFVLGFVS